MNGERFGVLRNHRAYGDQYTIDLSPHLARSTDPESSHVAAEEIVESGRAGTQAERILAVLDRERGRTAGELSRLVDLTPVQIRKRLPHIEEARTSDARTCQVEGSLQQTWYRR